MIEVACNGTQIERIRKIFPSPDLRVRGYLGLAEMADAAPEGRPTMLAILERACLSLSIGSVGAEWMVAGVADAAILRAAIGTAESSLRISRFATIAGLMTCHAHRFNGDHHRRLGPITRRFAARDHPRKLSTHGTRPEGMQYPGCSMMSLG